MSNGMSDGMSDRALDDLELELRRIQGVRAAGFDEREDMLLVQLHLGSGTGPSNLSMEATRIATRHADGPVAVEVVRWRTAPTVNPLAVANADTTAMAAVDDVTPAVDDSSPFLDDALDTDGGMGGVRARLLAVLSFPDTGEVEVHLVHGGRRTIGRAPVDGGLPAVVDATIEALGALGAQVSPKPRWARTIEGVEDGGVLVAVALESHDTVYYGLARGSSPLEAAARSTLDALNRRLTAPH